MELEKIPNVFWYSVSTAILIFTFAFSWTALQSRGMTIEIANAKIAVTGQLADLERVNEDLKKELEGLSTTKRELEQKIRKLEMQIAKGNARDKTEMKAVLESARNTISSTEDKKATLNKFSKDISDIRNKILQQQIAK